VSTEQVGLGSGAGWAGVHTVMLKCGGDGEQRGWDRGTCVCHGHNMGSMGSPPGSHCTGVSGMGEHRRAHQSGSTLAQQGPVKHSIGSSAGQAAGTAASATKNMGSGVQPSDLHT
jgi:hypothetical protein